MAAQHVWTAENARAYWERALYWLFCSPWVSPIAVADSCLALLQKHFSNYHLLVDIMGAREVQA
jgi:hypothetical protein